MRVVVLGGTRFIGVAIVAELLDTGHEVLVVHRGQTEPGDLPDVAHVHADRHDIEAVAGVLADFAAESLVDTCAYSTADATATVAALPRGCRAVVLSSMDTSRAFGALRAGRETDPVPLDESSPAREERYLFRGAQLDNAQADLDTYEKLDVEDVYLPAGATVLRLPAVYGARDDQRREDFVLRRVRAGRDRIPFGAGTFLWTRGWVDDVARAVRLAAEHPDLDSEVLNIGERRTWSVGAWARAILDAAGWDAQLVRVPDEALPDDLRITASQPQHVLVDSAKARAVLGWSDTDPVQALAASVRWHLDHSPAEPDPDFSADDAALAG